MKNKSIVLVLFLFGLSAYAAQQKEPAPGSCSYENLEKTVQFAAGFSDYMTTLYGDAHRLILLKTSPKGEGEMSVSVIRKRLIENHRKTSDKYKTLLKGMKVFFEAHPECDQNHYFTLKKIYPVISANKSQPNFSSFASPMP